MNRKYRLFNKIPVVDILIVAVLIAVFCAAVWVLTREDVQTQTGAVAQADEYPVTVTFFVNRTASENTAKVQVGDTIYTGSHVELGKVTKVEVGPYISYGIDTTGDGARIPTEVEGYSSIAFTVEGKATSSSNRGTYVGKQRLAYGAGFTIVSEKVTWKAKVIDLEVGGI